MTHSYRLSRRLAQIHISLVIGLTLSCSDSQAPTVESLSVPPLPVSTDQPLQSVTTSASIYNPNEPTGFTVISDRMFNAKVESGWTERGDAAFSIVSQTSAPRSPNPIGQAFFRKGFRGGGGPIATDLDLRGRHKKEIYVSFWVKFSSTFVGAQSSHVNKVYHVWIDGVSKVVFAGYGAGTSNLLPQMRLQNIDADPRGVSFNLNPNMSYMKMGRNKWYHVEILVKSNTPAIADGTIKWWVNGTPMGSYTGIGYVGRNNSNYWEQLSWAPTWGSPSDVVPADMYMYMDHVYVSGR